MRSWTNSTDLVYVLFLKKPTKKCHWPMGLANWNTCRTAFQERHKTRALAARQSRRCCRRYACIAKTESRSTNSWIAPQQPSELFFKTQKQSTPMRCLMGQCIRVTRLAKKESRRFSRMPPRTSWKASGSTPTESSQLNQKLKKRNQEERGSLQDHNRK